jgi:hypothetical protein
MIVVAALEFSERAILSYEGLFPSFVQTLFVTLRSSVDRNPSAYGNLFSSLAQIAGVFLGLYFTAVSVVASTVYARVQGDVRSLLLRDKVGNHYIGIVASLQPMQRFSSDCWPWAISLASRA